jgi:hypothetical protein
LIVNERKALSDRLLPARAKDASHGPFIVRHDESFVGQKWSAGEVKRKVILNLLLTNTAAEAISRRDLHI